MPSIVKVPRYDVYDDYDFIGFSFNGYHCIEDLGIIRVGNGTRYQENLTPQIQEQIGQHPGMDGAYLIGAQHRHKTFDIQFAFDNLTQDQVWKLHEVFSGENIHDLWFDEYPYKVWDAKVTGQPQLQVIPFDDGNGGILYKGEGTVQFTAYYPYAHTPDYVQWDNTETEEKWKSRDGRLFSSYKPFKNKEQWKEVANLWDSLPVEGLDVRGEAETKIQIHRINTYLNLPDGCSLFWLIENQDNTTTLKIIYTVPSGGSIGGIFLHQSQKRQRLCYKGTWEHDSSKQDSDVLVEIVKFDRGPSIQKENYYDELLEESLEKTIAVYTLSEQPTEPPLTLSGFLYHAGSASEIHMSLISEGEGNRWQHMPAQVVNNFVIKKDLNEIMTVTIPKQQSINNLSIDSRTGLVSAGSTTSIKPIYYEGRARVDLEPGTYSIYGFLPSEASYHFWYY